MSKGEYVMCGASTTDQVQSVFQEGILTVRINRPEKKNALTKVIYGALADALQRAEEDPAIRVVMLCGCDG